MKYLLLLFILQISYLSKAQTTGNFVSASGETKGVSISSSWAIGEVINETFQSSSLEASHGLNDQNFKYLITGAIEHHELLIYPIPFERSFNIVSSDWNLSRSVITLFDATGKQVHVQFHRLQSDQITISLEHSAPGLYLLLIQSEGSIKPLSFKVIKE